MPKPRDPSDPKVWLGRAMSSLLHAKSLAEGVYLEELCFDTQQAAEKAVKALFVANRLSFPYVHDLEALLSALAEHGIEVPEDVWDARRLNVYAVEVRYPSVAREVTDEQYRQAIAIAERVVEWVTGLVQKPA